jgi:hypothetical protein
MVFRLPHAAPEGQIPADRRGRSIGRFCLICASIYPLHRRRHTGRPLYGRDHVASPCAHEGDFFGEQAEWWQPAVEVLPEAAGQPANATLVAGSPVKGTEPEATGKA